MQIITQIWQISIQAVEEIQLLLKILPIKINLSIEIRIMSVKKIKVKINLNREAHPILMFPIKEKNILK
jgi:hypothetical protein